VNAFLAAALTRVMRAVVSIFAIAAASVVMWGPSRHLGSFTAANWVSFDFNVAYSSC